MYNSSLQINVISIHGVNLKSRVEPLGVLFHIFIYPTIVVYDVTLNSLSVDFVK